MPISAKRLNLVFVVVFVTALTLIEVWLRISGTRPGFIYSGISEVDSLTLSPCYYTDANGIQKLTPFAISRIREYVQHEANFRPNNLNQTK